MSEDLKKTLSEASNSYQQLLENTHTEALARNELQTKRWQDYKREHKELSERLLSLRDKLSHTIMVPLGNKALMRGKLVHTNEILVCLGDGWFVKQTAQQAAEMCQRRVEQCDEALEKLQKEEELLSSRKSLPFKTDAFGGDQAQELIEAYDEEAEKLWREKHRQKEKEYHQKLAEIRASQTNKIESEEDIWSRLDALDLQEELEDELNRMDGSSETEDDLEESEDESDSSSDQESDKNQTEEDQDKNTKPLTRRVSFKKDKEEEIVRKENNDELILIHFKHSNTPSYLPSAQEPEIRSPADIYSQYVRQRVPKSILKRTTSIEPLLPEDPVKPSQLEDIMKPEEPILKVIGDEVVERTTTVPSVVPCERPVSRFKAARMASKR